MLSDEKVSHLSHMILKGLKEKNLVALNEDEGKIRRAIRQLITNEVKLSQDMDKAVRRKIDSYAKQIIEGSSEWDILYKKFMDEEAVKKGR